MFEDDEFTRSLKPTQIVDRGSRVFSTEDSDMMNMIFQYLESDADKAAKEAAALTGKKWEPPQLEFDPSLVADFQKFSEYQEESSPSPTVSLFSESGSFNVSGASGLTTPRSLSNRSSRAPSRTEQAADELHMTTKPAHKISPPQKHARLAPSPPAAPSPRFERRATQNEVASPVRSPSPQRPAAPRKYELSDPPQEKRQNSYSDAHWPSLATVASKYERKGSRQNSYRNTVPVPPMATGARRDELEELGQAPKPAFHSLYSPTVYGAPQEKKRSQDITRPAYGASNSPLLESSARPRTSNEVSPSPYRSSYSPENSSARTYESRASQNSYRNTLPSVAESGIRNNEPTYSPSVRQNRPQPPPTDPSLRRYESFRMSGASAGRYQLKDAQENFPVNERKDSLDKLVQPKASMRSRFSFPKPMRATVTSFVDILPHAPPSPAATPPGESAAILSPEQFRIPTPDFSLPPRPKKEVAPSTEPLPSVLSVGRKDASTEIPTSVLYPARSSSGRSSRSATFRLSAPSLTIQIPESSRPAPQKVEHSSPGLTGALNKIKHESILARPRPKPRAQEIDDEDLARVRNAPTPPPKIVDASDSVLVRPRPKPALKSRTPSPPPVVEASSVPARVSRPPPVPAAFSFEAPKSEDVNTSEPVLARPMNKKTTFGSPTSPKRYTLEDSAPMIPAPNFSRTAHTHNVNYTFQAGPLQEPAPEELAAQFEEQEPVNVRPLNVRRHSDETEEHAKALKHDIPHAPAYKTYQQVHPLESASQKKAQALSQARWFHDGFCAGSDGLQLTMSRRVATFSKLEWAVESSDESRNVRCFTQTNTLSRRTDFFAGNEVGEKLFAFQRKTGSTRVGETADGTGLFSVRNSSFGMSPYWVVNTTADEKDSTKQWIAKGDDNLTHVSVTWGGFSVGRIACAPRKGKHTYTVDVSAEMNYAIMAALVTVFDDWRMDHAC
ncbi:uncharacterized protein PAC_16682 [Phialocephala subalpina]|uniref:Uncharacterized protein n=1 Tax=Phialocephala subalpina TaxID=576137 RepID=A0A1L7XP01_9HELO|nr:uncharacterized protein PAC_16682 [Phialocephala subalpina]